MFDEINNDNNVLDIDTFNADLENNESATVGSSILATAIAGLTVAGALYATYKIGEKVGEAIGELLLKVAEQKEQKEDNE